MILTSPRLRLVLQNTQETLAQIERFSEADRAQVSPLWIERMLAADDEDPWCHSFMAYLIETDQHVGGCAYKGPPTNGEVEISYGIEPDQQNRGYATEIARALIDFAFNSGMVQVVIAHTKSENEASRRVLQKCQFQYAGMVNDPEDGWVERWQLPHK